MADTSGLLEEVAVATSLREGPPGVERILRGVYSGQPIALKDLAVLSGIPLPVVAAARRELEKRGILQREGGRLALTAQGHKFLAEELRIKTRYDAVCPTCEGRTIVVGKDFGPVVKRMAEHFAEKPRPDTRLDQAPCLPEIAVQRALFLYNAGALEGKNVLLLGDDDSISIAIGLVGKALGRGSFARRITVIDADQRILDHIQVAARADGVEIECIRRDLREPLARDLVGQFDTFETDPPYTNTGAALFLSRAIAGLRQGVGMHGLLSYGIKSPDESLRLLKVIADSGLSTRQIIPSFNRYEGASILGGVSQLIHLVTTSSTMPLIPDCFYSDAIYTGEAAPTIRLYRCLRCNKEILVGHGQQYETIEKLKEAKCPRCQNTSFSYERRVEPPPALSKRAMQRKGQHNAKHAKGDQSRRTIT